MNNIMECCRSFAKKVFIPVVFSLALGHTLSCTSVDDERRKDDPRYCEINAEITQCTHHIQSFRDQIEVIKQDNLLFPPDQLHVLRMLEQRLKDEEDRLVYLNDCLENYLDGKTLYWDGTSKLLEK